ncbi:thioesterase family protein [Chitinophaga pendula]|uniref:acyl-CoA thioesterase n=1 Tax=Chitinophaga TaxID=79328 RepID=UPI000BAECC20|nr:MULTISPECIES: thioesterase family protein [Chitinophaga]ASZ11286.1 thioesterase [Chitinophaga sp. MD30]UCJ05714.1 thioesterase family protein [Chitinophaga pendula]
MARVKITMPEHFTFRTNIPVRITDVNYGGHVGNDAILSIIHEARLHFLTAAGVKELDPGHTSLIMADAALVFKGEGFHGDVFTISVTATEFSAFGFELYYRITSDRDGRSFLIAEAKTGMLCFDYTVRKLARLPEGWEERLSQAK